MDGVEGGEEVGVHRTPEGVERLVFDGADLNDAGVVDEGVDASEVAEGVVDQALDLRVVGEVDTVDEDVPGGLDGAFVEEGLTGLVELIEITGAEDEAVACASEAACQGQAKTAGAAGDEDDTGRGDGAGKEEPGGCDGGDAAQDSDGVAGAEGGFAHGLYCDAGCRMESFAGGRGREKARLFVHRTVLRSKTMATKRKTKGAYMISSVAEMYEIHPQTLRLYEREGLLRPSRSEGNTRLYTDEDLERLEFILNLARDLGVNIAGIAIVLQMRERMEEMNRQMQGFVDYVRTEMLSRMQQAQTSEAGLVPLRRPMVVPVEKSAGKKR